ncbi:hypothetical protein CANCADRAFT_16193, partial [Tortispora caseinolytica NRRL Y-17796]
KITKEVRQLRWLIHECHLVALLAHVLIRNAWCNDPLLHTQLRRLAPKPVITLLNPSPNQNTTLKSRQFLDGLRRAMDVWHAAWTTTRRGLFCVRWENLHDAMTLHSQFDAIPSIRKFRAACIGQNGSRDIGAQGFVAFLRALGLKVRLVCSLQPLPFNFSSKPSVVLAEGIISVDTEPPVVKSSREASSAFPFVVDQPVASVSFTETREPIYWAEVFNPHSRRWYAVDPMVLQLMHVPQCGSKLEPSLSDPDNVMAYVVGIDAQGYTKDLTPKYVKSFLVKTRKSRVTLNAEGARWWTRVMTFLGKKALDPLDSLEDDLIHRAETSDNLPGNIQDFKNHPIYVLERDLKANEVLTATKPCGVVHARGSTEALAVYRRADVKILHSAVSWYRRGREVMQDAEPLKWKDANRGQRVGLFAYDQTTKFEPKPVLDGRVPKNDFGNIEVFSESMVPAGGRYLPFKDVWKSAKACGVDYADAVVGFSFGAGNRAAAQIRGIVVPETDAHRVLHEYGEMKREEVAAALRRRERAARKRWTKYLLSLAIRNRLNFEHGEV